MERGGERLSCTALTSINARNRIGYMIKQSLGLPLGSFQLQGLPLRKLVMVSTLLPMLLLIRLSIKLLRKKD